MSKKVNTAKKPPKKKKKRVAFPEPPPKSSRCTKAELQIRINQIKGEILTGSGYSDLLEFAGKKKWGIKKSQISRYAQLAREQIIEDSRAEGKNKLEWHIEARKKLIKELWEKEEYSCLRLVMRDLALLQGLYPGQKERRGSEKEKTIYEIIDFTENVMEEMENETIN